MATWDELQEGSTPAEREYGPITRTDMSRLTRADVEHVAQLARLALTDDEIEHFTAQLEVILEHAAQIAALDTSDVPPTAHPLPVVNVLRADTVRPSLPRDEVLAMARTSSRPRVRRVRAPRQAFGVRP